MTDLLALLDLTNGPALLTALVVGALALWKIMLAVRKDQRQENAGVAEDKLRDDLIEQMNKMMERADGAFVERNATAEKLPRAEGEMKLLRAELCRLAVEAGRRTTFCRTCAVHCPNNPATGREEKR